MAKRNNFEVCPSDSELVNVVFSDGPLGITLKRRNGAVYVHDIMPNTQALDLDIRLDDELWSIDDSIIGVYKLDKLAWNSLLEYLKVSGRPLKTTWRRKLYIEDSDDEVNL